MDQEQEQYQFTGFFGIFKEIHKMVSTYRKIFTQITLFIILPLSIIFLAHLQISEYLFRKIVTDESALDQTPENTNKHHTLSDLISSEWTYFWVFKILYFVFFLILSLTSTSAIVYSVACIYTSKHMSFKTVISIVPKVWKRLMITFVWNFIIVFAFNVLALLIFFFSVTTIESTGSGIVILSILGILGIIYLAVFIYISVVWHLASVISVLEEDYGIRAMLKSKKLIKGKTGVSIAIYSFLNLCFIAIQIGFQQHVVLGRGSLVVKTIEAIIFFLLLSVLILVSLTAQTVVYFICKSFHHENIDKSLLADHLEVYLGDYLLLKSKDVQLEHFDI